MLTESTSNAPGAFGTPLHLNDYAHCRLHHGGTRCTRRWSQVRSSLLCHIVQRQRGHACSCGGQLFFKIYCLATGTTSVCAKCNKLAAGRRFCTLSSLILLAAGRRFCTLSSLILLAAGRRFCTLSSLILPPSQMIIETPFDVHLALVGRGALVPVGRGLRSLMSNQE
jgi:hypothetical protein